VASAAGRRLGPIPEAALLLGLSERWVWRLKSRFVAAELDPAALAHGDVGRVAAHRLDSALTNRVVAFARDGYAGRRPARLEDALSSSRSLCLLVPPRHPLGQTGNSHVV
jgi:hypothetical protein